MEKSLNQLLDRLQKTYGQRLVSVVLYGSAAGRDHQAQYSDCNVLCVLDAVSPREIAAAEEIFRWWRGQKSPAPLLMTEAEIADAEPCFPIELRDIRRSHRLLFGRDVIGPARADAPYYRMQVEHDLRAKFLRVRQKAAGVISDPDLLRQLLADSISTFCVLFRHALLLHGDEPGDNKRDVIARAGQRFGFDTAAFQTILDLREGRVKPRQVDAFQTLEPYLNGIATVIAAVKELE